MVTKTGLACLSSVVFVYVMIFNLEGTNSLKIPIKINDRVKRTSTCERHAICGTVQATSRGHTVTPLCSCQEPTDECPLVWDSADTRSIHQGSIQYKHCKETGSRNLQVCTPDQTAYTMKILTPYAEDEELAYEEMRISHKIHCTCPENHQHVQQGDDLQRIPFVGEIKTYSMSCAPYPTCEAEQACKTLSETKLQFMENELCKCEEGLHCPVTGNTKAKSFEFGVGRITQLFCQ